MVADVLLQQVRNLFLIQLSITIQAAISVPKARVEMTIKKSGQKVSLSSIRRINELSGENVKVCMQCATCSGMCPMTVEMDCSPRQVMHLAQFGFEEKLAGINTYWKCASCHACTVKCPRGIDIAKVMEALRQQVLRKSEDKIILSEIPKEDIKDMPQIAMVAGFRKLTS